MVSAHLRPVPDRPPRAVLYLRQSVQRDDSISIELQETAGRDYCSRQGYDIVAVEVDEGLSGRKWDNRPAVQRAMSMIEAKDADVIILWKWSRLSRSRKHWALAADRIEVAGGRIESATEPIDTATASGRFARGVMTEYAAFQSEQIGEQWEEVRQRRLRLGMPASGRLPWGWEWVKGEGVRVIPERAELVAEMYRRYLAGQGSASIARWLNAQAIPSPNGGLWDRVRPFTVMDSPIHAGLVPYRGKEYPGTHEGIIDAATWEQYKDARARRRVEPTKPRQSPYLLSSLVQCSCGRRMSGKGAITGGIWYGGYICVNTDPDHGPNYISAKKIDPLVDGWIGELGASIDREVNLAPQIERVGKIERLQAEWNACQARLDKLTRLLVDDIVSESSYAATRAEVESRQADISRELAETRRRQEGVPDALRSLVRGMARDWPEMPATVRHDALRTVLGQVVVTPTVSVEFISAWGESSLVIV